MAGQESEIFYSDIGEEEVTSDDLVIIFISSDSEVEAEEEAQVEPLVSPKDESEEEVFRLVPYSPSGSSQCEQEDSSLGGEEEPSTSGVGEIEEELLEDEEDEEEEAEVEEEMEEESEEEEVVEEEEDPIPIPALSRGRRRRSTPLAPASTIWQCHPNPPAQRPRVDSRASPAWQFFKVPIAANKAGANIVKCRLCLQEVSRGQTSRSNQARGTASMLRHLYSTHWNEMTASFRAKYRLSRCRALRLPVGQDVAGGDQPGGMPVSANSAEASQQPASEPSRPHPLPVEGDRFTSMCRFCMHTICSLDTDFESWRAIMWAHCLVCPRY